MALQYKVLMLGHSLQASAFSRFTASPWSSSHDSHTHTHMHTCYAPTKSRDSSFPKLSPTLSRFCAFAQVFLSVAWSTSLPFPKFPKFFFQDQLKCYFHSEAFPDAISASVESQSLCPSFVCCIKSSYVHVHLPHVLVRASKAGTSVVTTGSPTVQHTVGTQLLCHKYS